MKINFANADVDLWKVKPGVVVTTNDGQIGHISKIGRTNNKAAAALGIIMIDVIMIGASFDYYSNELNWCEPL